MRVIAYTYLADLHCVPCTKAATPRMRLDHNHPYAMGQSCKDEHGIEYDIVDREWNLIRPVFSTDENIGYPLPLHCGDCKAEIL